MAGPDLVVRVGANIDDLRKQMGDSTAVVATTTAGIQKLADTTKGATTTFDSQATATGGWTNELRKFDGVLASMGVHIGPEIKALGELGDASGKTVSSVGLLGSAGLALGVGMAAWGITRAAMEFLGLDSAVSKAWTSVLGLGDVAAETAGAKLDILARASGYAKREITDMGEALKINKDHFDEFNLQAHRSTDAVGDSARAVADWAAQIGRVKSQGNLAALTADLASQNVPLKDLTVKYGVHIEALQWFTREQATAAAAAKATSAAAAAAAKEVADAAAKLFASVQKIEGDYTAVTLDGFEKVNQASARSNATRFAELTAGYASLSGAEAALADDIAKHTLSTADYQVKKIWDVVKAEEAAFSGSLEQRAAYNTAVEALAQRQAAAIVATATDAQREIDALTIVVGGAGSPPSGVSSSTGPGPITTYGGGGGGAGSGSSGGGSTQLSRWDIAKHNEDMASMYGRAGIIVHNVGNVQGSPSMDHFADGVENAPGGWATVGERGPERMYVPPGANIYPTGSGPSGGGPQVIQLVVDGRVLASIVNDHNTTVLAQGRQLPAR